MVSQRCLRKWRYPDTSKKKDIESTLPSNIINWEMVSGGNPVPFQIIIHHNWYNFGSSHSLFGHFDNFEFLSLEQKIIMEKIKKAHKKLEKEGVPEQVQPMITEHEEMFELLAKREFIPHFINIMNGSTQKFFEMKEDKVILIMRCKVENEEDKFWSATFSDGTRHHLYESDGMLKLITFHRKNTDKVEEKMKEVKHWLFFEKSAIVSEEIGEQEGTFIQLNADSIEGENHFLMEMFRTYDYEKSDVELKEIMMGAISPEKPNIGKKNSYLVYSPNPIKQKQIDTSVINNSNEKEDKPVEVFTNSITNGSVVNKLLEKKPTCRRRNERCQSKNGKKDSEHEKATNKLTRTSSCSTLMPLSRRSSTVSLSSQPDSISRNLSQLSLNSIGSDAKKKQKKRKQKPNNIEVQKEIHDGIDISKIDQNKPSDQESTDSEALPVIEEDPRDKRVKERLRKKNVETHGMFRKEFMENEYS